jgi:hypothetical protein
LNQDHADIIGAPRRICRSDQVLAGTLKIGRLNNSADKILLGNHPPQTVAANHQETRLGEAKRKDIRVQKFTLAESAV